MIKRIDELLMKGETFAFETTLSSKTYKSKLLAAKLAGYKVALLFFWLQDVQLAKERVKIRVQEGGHDIESDVIERPYKRGIINLFDMYLPLVDDAFLFDNSYGQPVADYPEISEF